MGCGNSKAGDAVIRHNSAQVRTQVRTQDRNQDIKRPNSNKSSSSSSSSSSDDSKQGKKKEKKKKDKNINIVSPLITAKEEETFNNENLKPQTPIPKSASSRGSRSRKSSSSGFSEHERDALSIDPNDERKNEDDEDGEKKHEILLTSLSDQEEINETQKDTEPNHDAVAYINEDSGETNQETSYFESSQSENITNDKNEEENVDGIISNNENVDNKQADDDDLGIYEDNGNANDADDFDDTEPQMNGDGEDTQPQMNSDVEDTEQNWKGDKEYAEQQMDGDGDDTVQQVNYNDLDVPDTFLVDNNTERNKSTEPSQDDVNYESNENYNIRDDGDNKFALTSRSESEGAEEEEGLDVPDTFR